MKQWNFFYFYFLFKIIPQLFFSYFLQSNIYTLFLALQFMSEKWKLDLIYRKTKTGSKLKKHQSISLNSTCPWNLKAGCSAGCNEQVFSPKLWKKNSRRSI